MMTKIKLARHLLAALLGLTVAFLACACASIDAPSDNSSADEMSAPERSEVISSQTGSLETTSDESEPNEELSETNSDATFSEDIPIEPTYPEERETTLELVKEYPLGEGGIPFYLLYENDPTIADIIVAWFLADEKGNIYAYNGERFYDLQNKTSFVPPREERLIARELAIDGTLYCLTLDGTLNVYTSQGEKVDSVQYPKRSENGTYDLFAAPDGTLRVVVDGTFYDETGKKIAADYTLGRVEGKPDTLDLFGKQYTYENDLYVTCYANGILTAYDTQTKTGIDERLIYQYDKNGDPLSAFMIYRFEQSERISCNISYEDVVCKSFTPCSIVVGKHRFDNLIDANWFVGADGTIYLMLIDPDGGKLYKINPGYSDVEFTDYGAETEGQ